MSDFTATTGLVMQLNTGTPVTGTNVAVWTNVALQGAGTGQELRFTDTAAQGAVASASWPYTTRASVATILPYLHAFSADTTSLGFASSSSASSAANLNTPTLLNNQYLGARWSWDNVGTFASAPIFTAYASNAHAAITRGTPSGDILAGQTTDTGATQRSYLKGQGFGQVAGGTGGTGGTGATTTGATAPAAAPAAVPAITDGATGSLAPTAGANWLANWQGLQGDNDFITFPSTPAATTLNQWNIMFGLFQGPNMATSTAYTPVLSLKYTFV